MVRRILLVVLISVFGEGRVIDGAYLRKKFLNSLLATMEKERYELTTIFAVSTFGSGFVLTTCWSMVLCTSILYAIT